MVSNAGLTGTSSYAVAADGAISPITALVTGQAAACWTVVTPNGRYAYTTNTGAGNISGYRIAPEGSISLLDPTGITAVTGGSPADAALSRNGHYLYVRNGSRNAIDAFLIAADGNLTAIGAATGLPAGAVGLAAS